MRSLEDSRDVKDGGGDRAERNNHGVGGRAPEAYNYHKEFFIHGRELNGIVDAKSLPLFTKEFFHPYNPGCPVRVGRRPGSLRLCQAPFRPVKSL
ncbi:hypothetical protein ACFX2I_000099 [Malus domestica]